MNQDTERAAFEVWAFDQWGRLEGVPDAAWLGWKGRAAAPEVAQQEAAPTLEQKGYITPRGVIYGGIGGPGDTPLYRIVAAPAPSQGQAAPSDCFLVRDVAEMIGCKPLEVCRALRELGHGYYSVNMAVTRPDAVAAANHLRAAPQDVSKAPAAAFDMLAHLRRQRDFSERTFGPGSRAKGVVQHIRKELLEIEADPTDTTEWIDVAILALDGAWRSGATPEQIIEVLVAKQTKNEGRAWPDWRTLPDDVAIEHDRTGEAAAPIRDAQDAASQGEQS